MTNNINYIPVDVNTNIDTKLFNDLTKSITDGINSKVNLTYPKFDNTLNITSNNPGNITGVANGVDSNDAINYSQNGTGVDGMGIGVGNIILFHGNKIPYGFAKCDGSIPYECSLGINTPILPSLKEDVHYIIRIK